MFGSLISAGASLLGGLLGDKEQSDSNADNIALQREFAQHGIRWKVADAEAAGVHPLFALGANTVPFSPIPVGGSNTATALASAGQDVGRAIDSTRTQDERVKARADALLIERGELENMLLRSQIAKIDGVTTPPFPGSSYLIPGQTQSGVQIDPSKITTSRRGASHLEAAPPSPGMKEFDYPMIGAVSLPSERVNESIEDNLPYQLEHFYFNRIAPAIQKYLMDYPRRFGNRIGRYQRRYYGGGN